MATIEKIPGGTVTFRDSNEISKREERALYKLWAKLGPVAGIIEAAAQAARDGGEEVALTAVAENLPDISEEHYDTLFEIQDLTIVTFSASWTLDRPLPTLESVSDLPRDLYDALSAAVQKVADKTFSLEADPDPDAPFGA